MFVKYMTERKITINKEITANPNRFVSQVTNPGLQMDKSLPSKSKFVPRKKPTIESDVVEIKEQFPSSSAVPIMSFDNYLSMVSPKKIEEPSETPLTQQEYLSNLLPKVNKKQKREEEIVKTPTKKRTFVPVYSPSWSKFTPESVKQDFQNKQLEKYKPVALFQEEEEITEIPDFDDVETGGKKRNKKSNKNKRRILKKTKKMRKTRKTRKSKKSRKIRK